MKYNDLIAYLDCKKIYFELNKMTKELVSFNIGGPADIVIYPTKIEEIMDIVTFLVSDKIKYIFLGNGTNTIFSDNGYSGVVISTKKFNSISICDDSIICFCGADISDCCMSAYHNCLSGIEFAYGIPGSVGGFVYMNASAFNFSASDVVYKTTVLDISTFDIFDIILDEHQYSAKHSIFMDNKNYFIISTELKLRKSNKSNIYHKMQENLSKRKKSQPLDYPSAGSAFKRPKNGFASKLIDEAGLKGKRIGGATVSEKHAGFIVNSNNASFSDVIALVDLIKKDIKNKYGILLEEEIIFIE
ncbi:MAG: UDP-N-acetylmuramate dehydrogenase [Clostridia bacterium]|nr:UDP-N-acetylmuramate dehydrogenase [Clostridia bacterium]